MRLGSVFKHARLTAQSCKDQSRREHLRRACDDCKAVYDLFTVSADPDDFELLVGLWTRLLIAIKHAQPTPPDNFTAGRMPLAQEQQVA